MNREGVWPSLLKTDEVTLNLNDKHNLLVLKWNRGHRKVHFFGGLSKILLPFLHKNSPITAGFFFFSVSLNL